MQYKDGFQIGVGYRHVASFVCDDGGLESSWMVGDVMCSEWLTHGSVVSAVFAVSFEF